MKPFMDFNFRTNWIKKIPLVVKGAIGLATSIIAFIVLILKNIYLGISISVALVLIAGFCFSLYIAFSEKESDIEKGKIIYRFPHQYRKKALVNSVIFLILLIILVVYKPSRSFFIRGFVGTVTPTIESIIRPAVEDEILIILSSLESPKNIDFNPEPRIYMGLERSVKDVIGIDIRLERYDSIITSQVEANSIREQFGADRRSALPLHRGSPAQHNVRRVHGPFRGQRSNRRN